MSKYIALLSLLFSGVVQADNYHLPFEGVWFVAQGGDTVNVNHHMTSSAQAYGEDFAKVGGSTMRELVKSEGLELEDFYSWSQSVLAPAGGVIDVVVDGLPDNKIGEQDEINAGGNYISLKTNDGDYIYLAHFRQNSISVKVGERVTQGQELGLSGNSGNSTYPHIHMHIQSDPLFGKGVGQNIEFGPIDVQLTGKQFYAVSWPLIRGLFVKN